MPWGMSCSPFQRLGMGAGWSPTPSPRKGNGPERFLPYAGAFKGFACSLGKLRLYGETGTVPSPCVLHNPLMSGGAEEAYLNQPWRDSTPVSSFHHNTVQGKCALPQQSHRTWRGRQGQQKEELQSLCVNLHQTLSTMCPQLFTVPARKQSVVFLSALLTHEVQGLRNLVPMWGRSGVFRGGSAQEAHAPCRDRPMHEELGGLVLLGGGSGGREASLQHLK